MDIYNILEKEFQIKREYIDNTIKLIDEGNTIPFIARYRKEMTGEMSDVTLRQLNERLTYLRNLESRKEDVTRIIDEQGKLTEELTEDSLYKDLKGLQDAYETNLSDLGNEISDFRNAYMVMTDCEFEEEKIVVDEETGKEMKIDPILEMKKKGILMVGKEGNSMVN